MVLTPRPAGASLLSSGSPLSAQGPRASSRKGKASPWTLPAQPGPWPWVPAGPREEAGEETEEESSPLKTPLYCCTALWPEPGALTERGRPEDKQQGCKTLVCAFQNPSSKLLVW